MILDTLQDYSLVGGEETSNPPVKTVSYTLVKKKIKDNADMSTNMQRSRTGHEELRRKVEGATSRSSIELDYLRCFVARAVISLASKVRPEASTTGAASLLKMCYYYHYGVKTASVTLNVVHRRLKTYLVQREMQVTLRLPKPGTGAAFSHVAAMQGTKYLDHPCSGGLLQEHHNAHVDRSK